MTLDIILWPSRLIRGSNPEVSSSPFILLTHPIRATRLVLHLPEGSVYRCTVIFPGATTTAWRRREREWVLSPCSTCDTSAWREVMNGVGGQDGSDAWRVGRELDHWITRKERKEGAKHIVEYIEVFVGDGGGSGGDGDDDETCTNLPSLCLPSRSMVPVPWFLVLLA